MKPKYTFAKFNGKPGELVYPEMPEVIKSKEDLVRWFEHTGQFFSETHIDDRTELLNRIPQQFIREQTQKEIKIMFPRCKYPASALFTNTECYRISI